MHSRTDLLILLMVSFAIGSLFAITWPTDSSQTDHLLIQTPVSRQIFKLDKAHKHLIKTTTGTSEIEIKPSSARFIHSNCQNKICLQSGWLSAYRPIIACVPNQISIQLINTANEKQLDAFIFLSMSTNKQNLAQHSLTAGFAALAITIHLFESTLPTIMGIKPGLANVITLIVLLRHGLRMAVSVQLLRVFIASLLNGSIFTPTFFLSLCGSLVSLSVMSALYLCVHFLVRDKKHKHRKSFSPWQPSAISFSVLAAIAHMLGQFILAYYWLIPHAGLFKLLPFLLLFTLAFGWVNGIMTQQVLQQLEKSQPKTMLNDNDRLMTAFFVAIILHGVLILGITFESEAFSNRGSDQLEVVLIQGQSDQIEPEDAAYFAQQNQQGSGNTSEKLRASSNATQGDPLNNLGQLDNPDALEREVIADEAMRQYLAARKSNKQSVLIQSKPELAIADYRLQARLMMVGEQVLAPEEKNVAQNKITDTGDRELVVSINAKESNIANYIGSWRSKVERIGTLNYPKDLLEKNSQRSPVVEVSIARNGSIRKAKILRSSGSGTTDQAALRILRLAAPYDPFPKELAVGNDALTFVYEWHFSESGKVKGRALIDK